MKYSKYLPYGIGIVLLLVGAFFDYQIDVFLYDPSNMLGIVYERFLLLPLILGIPAVFAMLQRIHHKYGYLLLQIVFCVYAVYDIMHYFVDVKVYVLYLIPLSAILAAFLTLLFRLFDPYTLKCYEKFGIFFVCVFLTSMLVTTLIKQGWGRMRFRDLGGDASLFTNWYLPNGINGNRSFPSGHTTAISTVMCLMVVGKRNYYQKANPMILVFVTVCIGSMMLFRMVMGAHYLSDTAAGFLITYSVYLLYKRIFYPEEHYER